MNERNPVLFALDSTRDYGERVAGRLDSPLAAHEERESRTASTRHDRSRTCGTATRS